jgi:hypothetical protein
MSSHPKQYLRIVSIASHLSPHPFGMTIESINAREICEQTATSARTARRRAVSGAPSISSVSKHRASSAHFYKSKEPSVDSKQSKHRASFSLSWYFEQLDLHRLPTDAEGPIRKTDVTALSEDILRDSERP